MKRKICIKIILFFLIITGKLLGGYWKNGFYVEDINKRLTVRIQKEAYEVFGYEGDPTIENKTDEQKKKFNEITEFIRSKLEKAYYKSWSMYGNNKGNIKNKDGLSTNKIIKAIDKAYKYFKITIIYKVDKGRIQYYKNKYGDEFHWWEEMVNGEAKAFQTIEIINMLGPDIYYGEFSYRPKDCKYKGFYETRNQQRYAALQENKKKKISLASIMFHEMVHIALGHEVDTLSRYRDEATVEDITNKIFPAAYYDGENSGASFYRYTYDIDTANYLTYSNILDHSIKKEDSYKYKEDKISRSFNPHGDMKYGPVEYKNAVTTLKGRLRYMDDTWVDDCRDEKLEDYVIPYRICCNGSCTHVPPNGDESSGPGKDHLDDNYSFSDGTPLIYKLSPDSVVYTSGYWQEALRLYGGLVYDGENGAEDLRRATPFLIIPSGGLAVNQNNLSLKQTLKQYVSQGGTIIVFSQQYGSHIENIVPIPEGEKLKVYGWRQDQSCYWGSVYTDLTHPVLSSLTHDKATLAVDGYIDKYPKDSVILLRRTKNRKPAMLYYKYGKGYVVLTTLYTDWAYAHSQATTSELNIVRDLLTFSKGADSDIPMYNLSTNPKSTVSLSLMMKNDTNYQATKAKIKVLTPSRDKVIYEKEVDVNIEKGQETDIPFEFSFTDEMEKTLGIYHTEYELYDSEGTMIKMAEESESGRFSLYKTRRKYIPSGGIDAWLTIKNEDVWWDEKPEITLHVKNYTDKEKTLDVNYEYVHTGQKPFGKITIPAHGSVERKIVFDHEGWITRYWMNLTDNHHFWKRISKGFHIKRPETKSGVNLEGGTYHKYGEPVKFEFSSTNGVPRGLKTNIRVDIVNNCSWNDCNIVKNLFSAVHEFKSGEVFKSSVISDISGIKAGNYRLRLTVERPDGKKEVRYKNLYIAQSKIYINNLIFWNSFVNKQMDLVFRIKNDRESRVGINNGKVVIIVKNEKAQEAYRGEITGIKLNIGETKNFREKIDFNPPSAGEYRVYLYYYDETRPEPIVKKSKVINYKYTARLSLDKDIYQYKDTAKVYLTINGFGKFKTSFEVNGVKHEKEIEIPQGQSVITVPFEVPLNIINRTYHVKVWVESESGVYFEDGTISPNGKKMNIDIVPEKFDIDINGEFGKIGARVGEPVDFKLNLKRVSGFNIPVNGEIELKARDFSYDEKKSVIINPAGDNILQFSIPVPADILAGKYPVSVILKIDGVNYKYKDFKIDIPSPMIKLPVIKGNFDSGNTIEFDYENVGGKDGEFKIKSIVRDTDGKEVVRKEESKEIKAGEKYKMSIVLPEQIRSGKYIVYQEVKENNTGVLKRSYGHLSRMLCMRKKTYKEAELIFS